MDFELTRYEEIDVYNILDILRRSTCTYYPSIRESALNDEEQVKYYLEAEARNALTSFVIKNQKMSLKEVPREPQDRSADPHLNKVKFEGMLTVISQPDAQNISDIIHKIAKTVGPRIRLVR